MCYILYTSEVWAAPYHRVVFLIFLNIDVGSALCQCSSLVILLGGVHRPTPLNTTDEFILFSVSIQSAAASQFTLAGLLDSLKLILLTQKSHDPVAKFDVYVAKFSDGTQH